MNRRLRLHPGIVGDYDGAYDWVEEGHYDKPENALGLHGGHWDSYLVVEVAEEEGAA